MKLEMAVKGKNPNNSQTWVYVPLAAEEQGLLPTLAEWLGKSHDVSLWINVDHTPPTEEERTDLSEMRLFLLPVTRRALGDGAVMADAAYAAEHRIPLLPLFMEEGLEEEFNRTFGNLQALSPFDRDATAIPFAEKLEKYLSSVLLSDGMAERVRAAFDAYIFLSYRKKDRLLAQKLMRLIHENEFARDIAIWYDEFLVPGEDWSESIEEALAKSRLFALAVTPNLLEEGNFVKNVEYPAACVAGKPIVAAEVAETDREALTSAFPNLPAVVGAETAALPEALLSALSGIALRENDADPVHNFFIGLAYLSGIDVERDPERALTLITSSAEAGVPEAMEKLSQMYETGDGAERDYEASALWMEKLAAIRRRQWEQKQTEESYDAYFSALSDAVEKWLELARTAEADRLGALMCALAEDAARRLSLRTERDLVHAYSLLGDVAMEQRDFIRAKARYGEAYGRVLSLVQERNTVSLRRELSVCYCKLGDVALEYFAPSEAVAWFEKKYDLDSALFRETGSIRDRRALVAACNRLGDALMREGADRCEELYREGYGLLLSLEGEADSLAFRRDLSVSYERLGGVAERQEKWSEAAAWYLKAYEISRDLVERFGTVRVHRDLAVHCYHLGNVAQEQGDLDGAEARYREGLAFANAHGEENVSPELRRECAHLLAALDRLSNLREFSRYMETEEFQGDWVEALDRAWEEWDRICKKAEEEDS